ncbi:MAG: methyltransferase [Halanaerobiales bacterium]|nr:methyltransferase [Halanaerobiales bacterium]
MEEVNILIPDKLNIIQDSNFFKFGNDSVFLANFTEVKLGEVVVDLGSGSGVIPLLLAFKNKLKKVIGIEIQPKLVEMSRQSVAMNKMGDLIEIIEGDLRKASQLIAPGSIDLVISNPPYTPSSTGKVTQKREIAIARHEIYATLADVIREASALLKTGGRMAMVHRAWRLPEIFKIMGDYNLHPKKLFIIQSRLKSVAKSVIIEAKKAGNPGLEIQPVFIVYEEDSDQYTAEVKRIYGDDFDE